LTAAGHIPLENHVREQVQRRAAVQFREWYPVDGVGEHVSLVAADVAQDLLQA
jgi:hypothetical protein